MSPTVATNSHFHWYQLRKSKENENGHDDDVCSVFKKDEYMHLLWLEVFFVMQREDSMVAYG